MRSECSRRIPWAGEIFFVLRLIATHPIVWSDEKFEPSGILFVILTNSIAVAHVSFSLFLEIQPQWLAATIAPIRTISIFSEYRYFLKAIAFCQLVLVDLTILAQNWQRSNFASVFNQLNSLWLRLDRPSQVIPALALVVTLYQLAMCVNSVRLFLPYALRFNRFTHPLVAKFSVDDLTAGYFMFFPLSAFILMIAVYGALIDMLRYVLRDQNHRRDFYTHAEVKELVGAIASILTTFSSAVSPLLTFALGSGVLTNFKYIMLSIVPAGRDTTTFFNEEVAVTQTIWTFMFLAALCLSYHLENQLKELTEFVGIEAMDLMPKSQVQELEASLMNIVHPPMASAVFRFDPSVLLTATVFFVNYYLVFVQLRAIVLASC